MSSSSKLLVFFKNWLMSIVLMRRSDEEVGYGQAPQMMQAPQAPQAAPQQYMRPEMPVPPQPQPQGNPADFWNSFGNLADRDPANAWRYLNAAQQNPEVFRSKMLVME
jgi:hypothetical protein